MKNLILIFLFLFFSAVNAQTRITGKISAEGNALGYASVSLSKTKFGVTADSLGNYTLQNITRGDYEIKVSHAGFKSQRKKITITDSTTMVLDFDLKADNVLEEVVVTGTLKAVNRLESPVPVEVYKPAFFKKNPTANIFEALQNVNGGWIQVSSATLLVIF